MRHAERQNLRHHHRRRRLGRLRAGQPAERGQGQAGAAARSRRLGPRSVDQDPARLAAPFAPAQARLDVFRRTRSLDRRPWPGMRARPHHRRLVVDQRHGLCARPSRRLRPLGGGRPHGVVLRACAAVFPAPGILEGRRKLLSRRRRPADDADDAVFRSAGRCLRGVGAGRGLQDHARLQRRPAGRFWRLADDGARRPPLQRSRRLSAPGAGA